MEFSHRARTNTAQRLEKMDQEKKQAAQIKHIKWESNPENVSFEDQKELFNRKDLKKDKPSVRQKSLFSELLEKCSDLPTIPFAEYLKFDGNVCIKLKLNL